MSDLFDLTGAEKFRAIVAARWMARNYADQTWRPIFMGLAQEAGSAKNVAALMYGRRVTPPVLGDRVDDYLRSFLRAAGLVAAACNGRGPAEVADELERRDEKYAGM